MQCCVGLPNVACTVSSQQVGRLGPGWVLFPLQLPLGPLTMYPGDCVVVVVSRLQTGMGLGLELPTTGAQFDRCRRQLLHDQLGEQVRCPLSALTMRTSACNSIRSRGRPNL